MEPDQAFLFAAGHCPPFLTEDHRLWADHGAGHAIPGGFGPQQSDRGLNEAVRRDSGGQDPCYLVFRTKFWRELKAVSPSMNFTPRRITSWADGYFSARSSVNSRLAGTTPVTETAPTYRPGAKFCNVRLACVVPLQTDPCRQQT